MTTQPTNADYERLAALKKWIEEGKLVPDRHDDNRSTIAMSWEEEEILERIDAMLAAIPQPPHEHEFINIGEAGSGGVVECKHCGIDPRNQYDAPQPPAATAGGLPRLQEWMIRAACVGHYKLDEIDAVDMTFKDTNYNFREAFKRMWDGIRAEGKRRAAPPAATAGEAVRALAGFSHWHLDNWTDRDFQNHIPGIRKAIAEGLTLCAAPPAATAGDWLSEDDAVRMIERLEEAAIYNDTAQGVYRSGATAELNEAKKALVAALSASPAAIPPATPTDEAKP